MRPIEKATLIVGTTSVILNVIGITADVSQLSYLSILGGRCAALLFSMCIDKIRWYYFIPITLSLINTLVGSERLLFTEYLTQSIAYQISAYRLFTRNEKTIPSPRR